MTKAPVAPNGEPPRPVSFRTEVFEAGTVFPPRRQAWGEFNYAMTGVAEFEIEGTRYLSPPHYAIWIPPGTLHKAWNKREIRYVSAYVERALCADLPLAPCTLSLSVLLKAILTDFSARSVKHPETPEDKRLAQVFVDQIRLAPRCESYLPLSNDPLVAPVLKALQARPGDRRSLAEWARKIGTTERTLSRHFNEALGMNFTEWRQRLNLVTALSMLEAGQSVQTIAKNLGYNNPSAFIAMFRRLTGTTPTQVRLS